jgi:hypothetical protein
MPRSKDRRFTENWEQYTDWVDHLAPQEIKTLLQENSVAEILREISVIDLSTSKEPTLSMLNSSAAARTIAHRRK